MPSPLHKLIVDKSRYAELEKTIKSGVNINQRDELDEATPLEMAAKCGSLAPVKLLISLGASAKAEFFGENLFDLACYNSEDVRAYLCNEEDRLWEKFEDGTTDLHAAVYSGDVERFKRVLAAEPELRWKKNLLGKMVSSYAVGLNHKSILVYLYSLPMNPNAANYDVSEIALRKGINIISVALARANTSPLDPRCYDEAINLFNTVVKLNNKDQLALAHYYLLTCENALGKIYFEKSKAADTLAQQIADAKESYTHYQQALEHKNSLTQFDKNIKQYLSIDSDVVNVLIRLAKLTFRLSNTDPQQPDNQKRDMTHLSESFRFQKQAIEISFHKPLVQARQTDEFARLKINLLTIFRHMAKIGNSVADNPVSKELHLLKNKSILTELNHFFAEEAYKYYSSESLNSALIDLSNFNLTMATTTCQQAQEIPSNYPLQAMRRYAESLDGFVKAMHFLSKTAVQNKQTHLNVIMKEYIEALIQTAQATLRFATSAFNEGKYQEASKHYTLACEYFQKGISNLEALAIEDTSPLLQAKLIDYREKRYAAELQSLTADNQFLKAENSAQRQVIQQQQAEISELKIQKTLMLSSKVPTISKQQTVLDLHSLGVISPPGMERHLIREDHIPVVVASGSDSHGAPAASSQMAQSSLTLNSVFSQPPSPFVYVEAEREEVEYNPTLNTLP